ncbi:unnamed protein product [Enterobius vermicularis]|uniref:Calponin-homology (CH) domain-containing protein n=1 Tax=Enterobius vermicularis TaxID=51028 RepID=A0A0N4UWF7_ENTVE|nr:unnamed protein product [Enterobius vermicularis]
MTSAFFTSYHLHEFKKADVSSEKGAQFEMESPENLCILLMALQSRGIAVNQLSFNKDNWKIFGGQRHTLGAEERSSRKTVEFF